MEIVIFVYIDGFISFGKVVEVFGVIREEVIEEFKCRGIFIRMLDRDDVVFEVEVIECL